MFLVRQTRREGRTVPEPRVFRARQIADREKFYRTDGWNAYGLYWERWHAPDEMPLPEIDSFVWLDAGSGAVTQNECEQATGLSAPVCWDKMMDLV